MATTAQTPTTASTRASDWEMLPATASSPPAGDEGGATKPADTGLLRGALRQLEQSFLNGDSTDSSVEDSLVVLRDRLCGCRAKVTRSVRQLAEGDLKGLKLVAAAAHRHGRAREVANSAFRVLAACIAANAGVASKATSIMNGHHGVSLACQLAQTHSADAHALGGIMSFLRHVVVTYGAGNELSSPKLLTLCVKIIEDFPSDEQLCFDAGSVIRAATSAWGGVATAPHAVAGGESVPTTGTITTSAAVEQVATARTLCVLFAATHVNPSYRLLLCILHILCDVVRVLPSERALKAIQASSGMKELVCLLDRACGKLVARMAGGKASPSSRAPHINKEEARRLAPIFAQALVCISIFAAKCAATPFLTIAGAVAASAVAGAGAGAGAGATLGATAAGAGAGAATAAATQFATCVASAFCGINAAGDISAFTVAMAALARLVQLPGVASTLGLRPSAQPNGATTQAASLVRCLRLAMAALRRRSASSSDGGGKGVMGALEAAVQLAEAVATCGGPTHGTSLGRNVMESELAELRSAVASASTALARCKSARGSGRKARKGHRGGRSGSASAAAVVATLDGGVSAAAPLQCTWPRSSVQAVWLRTSVGVGDVGGDMGEWDLVVPPSGGDGEGEGEPGVGAVDESKPGDVELASGGGSGSGDGGEQQCVIM